MSILDPKFVSHMYTYVTCYSTRHQELGHTTHQRKQSICEGKSTVMALIQVKHQVTNNMFIYFLSPISISTIWICCFRDSNASPATSWNPTAFRKSKAPGMSKTWQRQGTTNKKVYFSKLNQHLRLKLRKHYIIYNTIHINYQHV